MLFVVALAVAFVLVNFIMFLYGVEISWHIFLCVFFAFAITSTAAYVYGSKLVGKAVAMALMEYDRDYIGVDVHVGHIDVSLFSGRIDIQHFQVDNPEGYQAEYLFKAERISIDIGMKRLLASRGGLIVIKELSLLKIDAIIEYDGYINALSKTNIQAVLDFMSKDGDRAEEPAPGLLVRDAHEDGLAAGADGRAHEVVDARLEPAPLERPETVTPLKEPRRP